MKKVIFQLMAGISSFIAVTVSTPISVHAAENDCPIVLVHAWAQRAIGLADVESLLNNNGYDTFTPAMGPFSSTWDRACELYAQIRGGTVDYGLAHSNKYKHARFGRTYPGFYPEWGQVNPATGKTSKVHLIGYCFGGLTSRMMTQLLAQGSAEEVAMTPASGLSGLFSGGHSWVLSLTSIVTPHDGTSLLDEAILGVLAYTDVLRYMLMMASPVLETGYDYDLLMDQWGFKASPGESMASVILRLSSASFWLFNKDFSNYDVMPDGIYAMNSWVKAQPDVYYFSLGADDTYKDLLGFYHPKSSMDSGCWGYAEYMGAHVRYTLPFFVTSKWWPNDGTVNTVSMNGPKVCSNTKDAIINFNGTPQVGKWNYLGTVKGVDHFQIIRTGEYYDAGPWFLAHAARLKSLPM